MSARSSGEEEVPAGPSLGPGNREQGRAIATAGMVAGVQKPGPAQWALDKRPSKRKGAEAVAPARESE